MPAWSPVEFPPGVVKNRSAEAGSGYIVDTIGFRFVENYAQTQGGWVALNTTQMQGRARGSLFWNTLKGSPRYAIGTHQKLYGSTDGRDVTDITPVRVTTYLTDPFKATDGSNTVTVTHTSHGRANGDTVRFYGNATIGGTLVGDRIIDGPYTIANVTTNTYDITQASVTAAKSLTGPFTTTNASANVAVKDAGHGKLSGQKVRFTGASAVGGITINGEYTITRVDADTYTITHGSNASSAATGGGTVSRAWVYGKIGLTPSSTGRVYYTYNLTDPFKATDGSNTVTVTHTAHGAQVGDSVRVYNAAAVGGVTINGEYKIRSVIDANSYVIRHSSEASTTASGGGKVHLEYDIGVGPADTIIERRGFGRGSFGLGAFGSTSLTLDPLYYDPRFWPIAKVGEDIIASPTGGAIYYWDVSRGGRATRIWQGPETCRYAYWSESKFLIALGINGEPLEFGWAAIGTVDEWTPTDTNTARQNRRVEDGSALVAGVSLSKSVDLILTDTAAYSHQYIGGTFIFRTDKIGSECGLVGPQAIRALDGVAYWLSKSGFKMSSGMGVQNMPNAGDIEGWMLKQIDDTQIVKTCAVYIPQFDEIRWYFVPQRSGEPTKSVTFMRKTGRWYVDTQRRTTGGHFNTRDSKPYMVDGGYVYQHETGDTANGSTFTKTLTTGPFALGKGGGWFEFTGFDPGFESMTGGVTITATAWDRVSETPIETETETIPEGDTVADFRMSGRWVSVDIATDGDCRLGLAQIETNSQGKNRR